MTNLTITNTAEPDVLGSCTTAARAKNGTYSASRYRIGVSTTRIGIGKRRYVKRAASYARG